MVVGLTARAEDIPGGIPARLHSPSGKYDIGFQPQAQRLYSGPHEKTLPSGIKCQVYSLSFYPAGKDTANAVTYFTDIQETPESKFPTPLNALAKKIIWSPAEDFVILPQEDWHQPSGTASPRQAVSLDSTKSVWQTADFPLRTDSLIWVTPLKVIGNVVEGCRAEVQQFDGKSGRTSAFQTADPPEGYEILSANSNQVVLKKFLTSCATDANRQTFHEDCVIMNLSFGRREIGSCPH